MSTVFMIMLAVVWVEHFVFPKIFSVQPFTLAVKKPFSVIWVSVAVMAVLSVAAAVSWLAYSFIWANVAFQAVIFILLAAAFAWSAHILATKHAPVLHNNYSVFGLLMMINCSIMSVILIAIAINNYEYDLMQNIIHVVFSTAGFAGAVMIFTGIQERLKFTDPPPPLKGIPMALIAAGLTAMVFISL